jgi:hypothetical protein
LELADTSVWARKHLPSLGWFAQAVQDGHIAVCDQVVMELLYSTQDGRRFRETEDAFRACPWIRIEPADWDEARRVFRSLADRGPLHHRQVGIPDLLIAATAARYGMTLVHYDGDFDIIASVTGQPTRWAAPAGSL